MKGPPDHDHDHGHDPDGGHAHAHDRAGIRGFMAGVFSPHRHDAAESIDTVLTASAEGIRALKLSLAGLAVTAAFQFVVVLYLQELRGWSALETGLALLVVGIDLALAPTVTPRLVSRFGTVPVIFAGMVLAAAGYALFLPLGTHWSYAAMLPTFVLLGLAFSLAYGALTIAATDGVAQEEQGLAGGLLNVSLQFGAAFGLAVATAVNVAATGADSSSGALLDGYRAALIVPVTATVLGAAITATGLVRYRREPAPASGAATAHAVRPSSARTGAETSPCHSQFPVWYRPIRTR